jgi:hypothetical protein
MEILVLVILYLVVSVERLFYLKQERALRKDMYPICIRAGIRLHRGQNTLPHDELPLVIHQSCIGKK